MLRLALKYCKSVVCLLAFMLTAVCGFAHDFSEKAKKAVFDGIELPDFADASAEMCNCLMFSDSCMRICTQPRKLHFCQFDILTSGESKTQNVPTYTQFALNVPTISEAVRERRQAAESQQSDLDSSFVDDGKVEKCRDGEFIKNTSLLFLDGLLYLTLGVLLGDNDGNGINDLFEQ
jgi:hypothetical protein